MIGGSRYYDWRGFIPFEQLPSEHGSTRPWLVASTHPEELGYRRRVIWLWSSPGAATRLRTRLGEGPPFELARVLALQREQESERGRHVVRELFDAVELKSANAVTLRTILREWDGRTDTASRGALVYHVFRHELTRELLNARLGSDWGDEILAASEPLPGVILERLLDRARPAATTAVVESALVKTWRFLQAEVGTNPGRWGWGALHQLRLRHAFEQLGHGRIRWLGRPWVGVHIPSVGIPIRSGRCITASSCAKAPTWDPDCDTRSIWRIRVMRSSAWPGGNLATPVASTTTTASRPGWRAVPRPSGYTRATSPIIESDLGSCVRLESRPRE